MSAFPQPHPLARYRRIAVVGASGTPGKFAHDVPLLMREKGYEVLPVNPGLKGEWEGGPAYDSLEQVPGPIEIVDVFRPSDEAPAIARQAVEAGAKVLWLQSGITSDEARRIAEAAGLEYVEDRCVKIDWYRLNGQ